MSDMEMTVIKLNANGSVFHLLAKRDELLVDVLRDRLGLTGTKRGCGSGKCGACTILIDGRAAKSCRVEASKVQDKEITTIEGLASEGKLDPLQKAFIEYGAVQCGFCTPGMILTAKSLLNRKANPNQDEIKKGLVGNVCRCTGYAKIIEAIEAAASEITR